MKFFASVLLMIVLMIVLAMAPGVDAFADNDLWVATYPNATEMPEATARLLETKGTSWLAARAYRTNDSIKDVVKYFRELAVKSPKPADGNEFVNRLLQDNWKVMEGTLAGANVVFGVGKELREVSRGKNVKHSFGTILLDDSFVRVHIMSPFPASQTGLDVADGTMIVMIRERVPARTDTVAGTEAEEEIFSGREVTRKVRLLSKPEPSFPLGVHGTVVLRAVFGSSGKVTKIVIVQGVPGMTEEAIKAARKIRFEPAIKDGRYVAMWLQLEYHAM